MTGIARQDKVKVIPFGPGEAHLQNKVAAKVCYICKKDHNDDMVLLRLTGKDMVFACPDHKGVIQEFIRQFGRMPLGWNNILVKE